MRTGQMRHRVKLLVRPTSRDSMNQRTGEPTVFAERWANVRAADGREAQTAAQTGARLSHVVEMRYLAGVRTTMELEFESRMFDVTAVIPDGKKRRLDLHCVERPS